MQLGHGQVIDQARGRGVEHQGIHDHTGHEFGARKTVFCQRKSREGADEHSPGGSQDRDEKGIENIAGDRHPGIRQDQGQIPEIVERRILDEQPGRKKKHLVEGLESVVGDEHHRIDAEYRKQPQKQGKQDIHAQAAVFSAEFDVPVCGG